MTNQNRTYEPVFCYACGRRYEIVEKRCIYCHVRASDDIMQKARSVWLRVCGSISDEQYPDAWSGDDDRAVNAVATVNALSCYPSWIEIVETLGIFPDRRNEVLTLCQFRQSSFAKYSTQDLLMWLCDTRHPLPDFIAHLAYRLGQLQCLIVENGKLNLEKTIARALDALFRETTHCYIPEPNMNALTFLEALPVLTVPRPLFYPVGSQL